MHGHLLDQLLTGFGTFRPKREPGLLLDLRQQLQEPPLPVGGTRLRPSGRTGCDLRTALPNGGLAMRTGLTRGAGLTRSTDVFRGTGPRGNGGSHHRGRSKQGPPPCGGGRVSNTTAPARARAQATNRPRQQPEHRSITGPTPAISPLSEGDRAGSGIVTQSEAQFSVGDHSHGCIATDNAGASVQVSFSISFQSRLSGTSRVSASFGAISMRTATFPSSIELTYVR
jgi:hypothetical protein